MSCARRYLYSQDLDANCDLCGTAAGEHEVALTLRDLFKMLDKAEERAVLAERAMAALPQRPVHVLRHGHPLCYFVGSVPAGWPQGHTWVGMEERGKATCATCIDFGAKLAKYIAGEAVES